LRTVRTSSAPHFSGQGGAFAGVPANIAVRRLMSRAGSFLITFANAAD
jgi:hypothetical protein